MKKILFTWLGNTDLLSAENNGAKGLGPICQALMQRNFDQTVILSDYPDSRTKPYLIWLKKQGINGDTNLVNVDLRGNPTDYRAIYKLAKNEVQNYLDSCSRKLLLTFHLSPGTSQMATIWVILANSIFDAKLLQSSPERGVQDVDFPFDISADYLPELLKKSGQTIVTYFNEDDNVAGFEAIIHRGTVMQKLVRQARKVAPYPVPVLIMGESGTGKEQLAKAIHTTSLRQGKFVVINCGAIPEDLFESELFGHKKGAFTGADTDKSGYIEEANGGTLFLDEIGEMPLKIQVKLLRLVQEDTFTRVGDTKERKADIRIISATNRNLVDEVEAGTFRDDMFHRIAVAILNVPALRERDGDLNLLADHLLGVANKKLSSNAEFKPKRLSVAARKTTINHRWPGNVRELQNTLMRAALWSGGDTIDKQDIDDAMLPVAKKSGKGDDILGRPLTDDFDLEDVIHEVASHYLERALEDSGGVKKSAAKLLNFKNYQTLDNWLKKYIEK